MSNRTIVELNHDHSYRMNSHDFLTALSRYLGSGSEEDADHLKSFGVRVFGMRHHSDPFSVTLPGKTITG